MALLKADVEGDFSDVSKKLLALIPELNGGFLGYVGKKSRTLLKMKYLSGQEIDLRMYPKDSIGRNTISSDVNKKRTETKIYSYPVNLFEKGRTLRDGSREAGKYIITKKLKQDVMMNMSSYASYYDTKVQKDLDKI